jgi:hypothetical protein
MSSKRFRSRPTWALVASLVVIGGALLKNQFAQADFNHVTDTQNFLALPVANIDGIFPQTWSCSGAAPSPQSVIQLHRNWHCANPNHAGPNWGNRFFGFHKQFLSAYDHYLASVGEAYIQTWEPSPNALIPPPHQARLANTACVNCVALPGNFRLPAAGGTLDGFSSLTSIGDAIINWHDDNHGNIASAGASDMGSPATSPRDPIFYRYHHIFDDVQDAWRTHQANDIAVVFDRSGSMDLPAVGGGTRLQAAKDAASLFADLLENGSAHRLGMVSFSTAASSPADMPLTNVAGAPAAMTAALGAISASGSTSIGDGLTKAQTLVNTGTNPRKAILLLTDGMENTAPTIASAALGLGDTHVCSVGLGTPGTLDGDKLQQLSERQGGIYISGPSALELKKFFVFCFADIFDTFVGADPIATLPAAKIASKPLIHGALDDQKLVFVLSWTHPLPNGALRLSITRPDGSPLALNDPNVESVFGPTWHIVRLKTVSSADRSGRWQARAVRPHRGFVNGFSNYPFQDENAGINLIRSELARVCPDGCKRVLYFEDPHAHETFDDHLTVYGPALFGEVGRGIGTLDFENDPEQFAKKLKEGGQDYDLIVSSVSHVNKEQAFDEPLARLLCQSEGPRYIVSDARETQAAQVILRCAGALRGGKTNLKVLNLDGQLGEGSLKLRAPMTMAGMLPVSYELKPTTASDLAQATSELGGALIVARGVQGVQAQDEPYFITSLTRASARVLPFAYRGNTYTGESLHPTFHIPAPYWSAAGYDSVKASVRVTRPTASLNALVAKNGVKKEGQGIEGDSLSPRQAAIAALDPNGGGKLIPTEIKRFELRDDGTAGDTTANDHYWEVALPANLTQFDGQYVFHAVFELCRAKVCVTREAEQTVNVQTKLSNKTKVSLEKLSVAGNARNFTRVLVTPLDNAGGPLGPGLLDRLTLTPKGDVKIERSGDTDGRGTYEIVVSWTASSGKPSLSIGQFGRPKETIVVSLQ